MMILLITAIAGWYFCGVCSFVYWWTMDFDLNVEDLLVGCVIGGPLGVFMFPLGWVSHVFAANTTSRRVVIKQRKIVDE